jgi:DNA-binding protein YbaB
MILPPGHLWAQLQRRQQEIERVRAEAARKVVTIDVGGGLVRVTVGGDLRIRHILIAPQALQNREELEDLLVTGVNKALDAAVEMVRQELQPLEHLYPSAVEQLPR